MYIFYVVVWSLGTSSMSRLHNATSRGMSMFTIVKPIQIGTYYYLLTDTQ